MNVTRKRFTRTIQPRNCHVCGKLTTWSDVNGNIGLDLCKSCFDRASKENEHYDGYHETPKADCRLCVTESVDFAMMNERQSGSDPLLMTEGAACVYADQYGIAYATFFAELKRRGWEVAK